MNSNSDFLNEKSLIPFSDAGLRIYLQKLAHECAQLVTGSAPSTHIHTNWIKIHDRLFQLKQDAVSLTVELVAAELCDELASTTPPHLANRLFDGDTLQDIAHNLVQKGLLRDAEKIAAESVHVKETADFLSGGSLNRPQSTMIVNFERLTDYLRDIINGDNSDFSLVALKQAYQELVGESVEKLLVRIIENPPSPLPRRDIANLSPH